MAETTETGDAAPAPAPAPVNVASKPAAGFDPAVGNQFSALTLTQAMNQQQLNALNARTQLGNNMALLQLSMQTNHLAAMKLIFKTSPLMAAAASDMLTGNLAGQLASLQAASQVPQGAGSKP